MDKSLIALIVDDDEQVRRLVAQILRAEGWETYEVESAERAFELLRERDWALVICDVVLGGVDGYAVLRRFVKEKPEAHFVLITGHESAAGALDATAIGAYDYLVKPFSVEDIIKLSNSVRSLYHPQSENAGKIGIQGHQRDDRLIGRNPSFIECLKLVGRVAATNLPVLITGESGTGKEVVARAIHQRSNRAGGAFVAVNCGAIPVELIESELFGHSKGSFTGADRERSGLWEEADGGTIFLDEITETGSLFQVKLLRSLQEHEIRRVGANKSIKIDARVIAATNRDIETEVREGRFRQDLMYRLNAITIHLPPLRERPEDIPLLAEHFAAGIAAETQKNITFSHAALELLQKYYWQGNIRELENAVLYAVTMCENVVHPEHLPEHIRYFKTQGNGLKAISGDTTDEFLPPPKQSGEWLPLSEMEAEYVARVLAHTGGNKQAAARLLKIDRKTLIRIVSRIQAKA